MYEVNKNNEKQHEEINLMPVREIRKMGIDFRDIYLFGILVVPIFIVALSIGFTLTMGLVLGAYLLISILFCFAGSKQTGKLRTRIHHWIIRQFMAKKQWNEQEIKAYSRFKELKDNHIRYKNEEREGYISFYRISGYDLSLSENAVKNQIIEECQNFWGHQSDYDIISTNILYQIAKKEYKLKKTNADIKSLQDAYDAKINQMNNDTTHKQQAYFLVLNGDSIENNEKHYATLATLIREAKINIVKANTSEISQILNELWPSDTINVNLLNKVGVKHIRAHKNYLRLYREDKTSELMGFKCVNALPDIARHEYLRFLLNDSNYTVYMSTKHLDRGTTQNILYSLQNAVSRTMSTRWYKKHASDIQRTEISKVDQQIKFVSDQIGNETHVYDLKEICIYVLFKGITRKEIKKKMDEFEEKMTNYNRGFVVNDLNYFQIDAFTNTRCYELPSLQFRKSYWDSFKNAFRGKKVNVRSLPMEIVKLNAIHVLNTSLAIGYPFINNVSIGEIDAWYKGNIIDQTGLHITKTPIFENYWRVDSMYNSFNRIALAFTGAGKTWTIKRDMIQDYFDDHYIFCIDPKPDYGKMTQRLGGANVILGRKNVRDKENKTLNLWDVLTVPKGIGSDSEEAVMLPLDRTYIKNDAIVIALLNLSGKADEEEIMAAWRKVQKYVYENKNGPCKFTNNMDFRKISKTKMPITQHFYETALKMSHENKENVKAMRKLAILLEQYDQNSTYSYLFNVNSNINWNENQWFTLDISNITRTSANIFAAFVICQIQVAIEIMIANKNSGRKFALYIDELHSIRHIPGVMWILNKFERICRSHNGATILVDQGLGVVKDEATIEYKEIFKLTQYGFYFKSPEDDINMLTKMLSSSGLPLSDVEHKFIARASPGQCLTIKSAWDRYRLSNDISHWLKFLNEVKSEGA